MTTIEQSFDNLTTDELADEFSVTAGTVRKWASQGCPHVKDKRGHLRFDAAHVAHWRRENQSLSHGRAAPNPSFPVPFPGNYVTTDMYGLERAHRWFVENGREDIADALTVADGRKVAMCIDYANAQVFCKHHGIDFESLDSNAPGYGLPLKRPSEWDSWFELVRDTPSLTDMTIEMWNKMMCLALRHQIREAGWWEGYFPEDAPTKQKPKYKKRKTKR